LAGSFLGTSVLRCFFGSQCPGFIFPAGAPAEIRTTGGPASSVEAESVTRIRLAVINQFPQLPAQRGVHARERGGGCQCQTFQPAGACSEDRRPALSPEENPSPQSLGASLPARSAELWGMHTSPRSGDPRKQTRLRPPNPVVRWCNQRFPLRKSHRIGFSRSHSQSKMLSPNLLVQRTSLCSRLSLRDRLLPASSGAPCRVLAPQHSRSYSASS